MVGRQALRGTHGAGELPSRHRVRAGAPVWAQHPNPYLHFGEGPPPALPKRHSQSHGVEMQWRGTSAALQQLCWGLAWLFPRVRAGSCAQDTRESPCTPLESTSRLSGVWGLHSTQWCCSRHRGRSRKETSPVVRRSPRALGSAAASLP